MSRRRVKETVFDYDTIRKLISESSDKTAIYVGCDSIRKRGKVVFVTVIIVHMHNGLSYTGGKLFKSVQVQPNYEKSPKALRLRLMNEVYYASEAAMNIVEAVGSRPFELHLDINPNPIYNSNVVVKEAIGYVLGTLGFAPKLKPDSFAASIASDRYVRKVSNVL